jgi:hypothetical protein
MSTHTSDSFDTDTLRTPYRSGQLSSNGQWIFGSMYAGMVVLGFAFGVWAGAAKSKPTEVAEAKKDQTDKVAPRTVVSPPIILPPGALPAGQVGVPYSRTITPTGGTAPVTLVLSSVSNPTGVTISGSGGSTIVVSGTPSSTGTVTFTVTPSDASGPQTARTYTFDVSASVAIAPVTPPAPVAEPKKEPEPKPKPKDPEPKPEPKKPEPKKPDRVVVFKDVQPILRAYCNDCHGGAGKAKGGVDTTTLAKLLKSKGPPLQAGKPLESPLYTTIKSGEMPPDGKKGPNAMELQLLYDWIAGGAKERRRTLRGRRKNTN